MTPQQLRAVSRLEAALDNAHRVGLRGGVYESRFRVWPTEGPQPFDSPCHQFFEVVEKTGATCFSEMLLDGGAGA